jgi:hypothetical protein
MAIRFDLIYVTGGARMSCGIVLDEDNDEDVNNDELSTLAVPDLLRIRDDCPRLLDNFIEY